MFRINDPPPPLNAVENKQKVNVRQVISETTHFVVCLVFLISCLNPILYVFMCEEVKQSLLLETTFAEEHLDFLDHKDKKRHQCFLDQLQRQENNNKISL